MELIKAILNFVLGYKYRVVILRDRGVERYWVCSYIFEDTAAGKARLKKYLASLDESVRAHVYHETVSFRSRQPYGGLLIKEMQQDGKNELRRYAKEKE